MSRETTPGSDARTRSDAPHAQKRTSCAFCDAPAEGLYAHPTGNVPACRDCGTARDGRGDEAPLGADALFYHEDADGEGEVPDEPDLVTDGGQVQGDAVSWDDLTRFQIDLLLAAAGVGPCKGLALKTELEDYYGTGVNHGRVYPNLNDLDERGLLEKQVREPNERSNQYRITQAGRDALQRRQETIGRALSHVKTGLPSAVDAEVPADD